MNSKEQVKAQIDSLVEVVRLLHTAISNELVQFDLLQTPSSTEKNICRYARSCLDSCAATFTLIECNFYQPAMATTRLAYEHLFYFNACVVDPGLFLVLQKNAQQSTARQVRELVKRGTLPAEELRAAAQQEHKGTSTMKLPALAEKCGLGNLYDSQYRTLSQLGAHPTTVPVAEVFFDPGIAVGSGINFEQSQELIWPTYLYLQCNICLRELSRAYRTLINLIRARSSQ